MVGNTKPPSETPSESPSETPTENTIRGGSEHGTRTSGSAIDISIALKRLNTALATVEKKLSERAQIVAERQESDAEISKQIGIARRCTDDAAMRLNTATKDLHDIIGTLRATSISKDSADTTLISGEEQKDNKKA
ncbi:MAG: hypothetical protein AAF720_06985 [Pseudomonadota bacterium]